MSFVSTYSAASKRGWTSDGIAPSNYNLLYSIEQTGNYSLSYEYVYVSRSNIGNGTFILTRQTGLGGAPPYTKPTQIRDQSNNIIFNGNLLTSSLINEQGNLLAGVYELANSVSNIAILEYQGNTYVQIANLLPRANRTQYNGVGDWSGNANILITTNYGGPPANDFVSIYTRSGNSFTLKEHVDNPNANYNAFGSVVSISNDGNTFITTGELDPDVANNVSKVLIYSNASGNYTLHTTLSGNSYFGQDVKLNASGTIAYIRNSTNMYVYNLNNNVWSLTSNIAGNFASGSGLPDPGTFTNDDLGSTLLIGNYRYNSNTGQVQNYYKNIGYTQYANITWANATANSYYGRFIDGDNNANIIGIVNRYGNGSLLAGNGTHVLQVYQKS